MPSIDDKELSLLDAWWRAANYLAVGQIYLLDNPLLKRTVGARAHQAQTARPLGHVARPRARLLPSQPRDPRARRGHDLRHRSRSRWSRDRRGRMARGNVQRGLSADRSRRGRHAATFRQFSFPGGIPSHVAPETPGSIHEGGELGYALTHAYGAAFDNPDLVVACVIGDGEAETGPLAASWHSNKFLDPARDGSVLPILHLNGYKIANPTVLARIPEDELRKLLEGYGHRPWFVEGSEPTEVHQALAACMDEVFDEIAEIKERARSGDVRRPAWPCIVLRTPKGWTGPKELDGKPIEGTFRGPPGAAAEATHRRARTADARGVASLVPARRAVRRRRHVAARPRGPRPERPSAA